MVKKPFHQKMYVWISYFLVGFIALGTFLDAVSNAISIINQKVAYICSITLIILWISTEVAMKFLKISWVIAEDQKVYIRSLGVKVRLALIGCILLLCIPILAEWHDTLESKEDRSKNAIETLEGIKRDIYEFKRAMSDIEIKFLSMDKENLTRKDKEDIEHEIGKLYIRKSEIES